MPKLTRTLSFTLAWTLERIIQHIKRMGPLEVICLQGAALSRPDATASHRREFGNLTLVKVPLLDQRIHCLPMLGSRYPHPTL